MKSGLAATCLGLAIGIAACGGGAAVVRGDGGGDTNGSADGASDGPEAGGSCMLAATGQFTFHVHNAGTSALIVDLGCGATSPITLATPAGTHGAGPGNADRCEFSCDLVYAGHATAGGCTDCGGGVQRPLPAGGTVDVAWDRRVYVERAVDPQCSAAGVSGMCALGIFVEPTTAQAGTVTTCPSDQHPTASCLQPMVTSFTVDTTGPDATVDVGP